MTVVPNLPAAPVGQQDLPRATRSPPTADGAARAGPSY